jgi:hypothetical protein
MTTHQQAYAEYYAKIGGSYEAYLKTCTFEERTGFTGYHDIRVETYLQHSAVGRVHYDLGVVDSVIYFKALGSKKYDFDRSYGHIALMREFYGIQSEDLREIKADLKAKLGALIKMNP